MAYNDPLRDITREMLDKMYESNTKKIILEEFDERIELKEDELKEEEKKKLNQLYNISHKAAWHQKILKLVRMKLMRMRKKPKSKLNVSCIGINKNKKTTVIQVILRWKQRISKFP